MLLKIIRFHLLASLLSSRLCNSARASSSGGRCITRPSPHIVGPYAPPKQGWHNASDSCQTASFRLSHIAHCGDLVGFALSFAFVCCFCVCDCFLLLVLLYYYSIRYHTTPRRCPSFTTLHIFFSRLKNKYHVGTLSL